LAYVTPLDGTVLSGTFGVRTIKYLLAAGVDAVNEPETLEVLDVRSKLLGPLGAVQLGGALKVYVCPKEGLFPPLYTILAALDVPLVVDDHKDEEEERQLYEILLVPRNPNCTEILLPTFNEIPPYTISI